MEKSLDRKLRSIHADPSGSKEFILADAKDADMAFGIGAPGKSPERHDGEVRFKSLAEYRDQIREVIRQGIVDIVLMSPSTSELLTIEERLFDDSPVTPAARANDTTDIHLPRGGRYHEHPSRPFRTASIDHLQCGHVDCRPEERRRGVDLGLYSITFNNRLDFDLDTLERFKEFREEAERKGFRYFLEIFDPNMPDAVAPELTPGFINDLIARTLAGVTQSARPLFLKMVYHGPRAMEELVNYDPHLVVGVLGGAAGTTLDAFQLLYEAKKYGARAALFGRKINNAEHQLAFIQFLRLIADGEIEPVEAVKAYHGVLQELKIPPHRSLEEDLTFQTAVMSYSGSGTTISLGRSSTSDSSGPPAGSTAASGEEKASPTGMPTAAASGPAVRSPSVTQRRDGTPDFARMSPEERLQYHRDRLNRMFGG
ncbi:MAG: hypothetical protein GXP27_03015 [Planctomycetes bacterium]|nr:hypothetical protein [Planctomycetota bacterium]